MAYSDWTQYNGASSNHSVSTSNPYEGNASLFVAGPVGDPNSLDVPDKTLTDSPDEAAIITQANLSGTYSLGICFRVQDGDNYYSLGYENGDGIRLDKRVGGSTSFGVDQDSSISISTSGYQRLRFQMWNDLSSVYFRISEDVSGDDSGDWSQLGRDLSDGSPSLSSGGGVGIASSNQGSSGSNGDCYYDNVEIQY